MPLSLCVCVMADDGEGTGGAGNPPPGLGDDNSITIPEQDTLDYVEIGRLAGNMVLAAKIIDWKGTTVRDVAVFNAVFQSMSWWSLRNNELTIEVDECEKLTSDFSACLLGLGYELKVKPTKNDGCAGFTVTSTERKSGNSSAHAPFKWKGLLSEAVALFESTRCAAEIPSDEKEFLNSTLDALIHVCVDFVVIHKTGIYSTCAAPTKRSEARAAGEILYGFSENVGGAVLLLYMPIWGTNTRTQRNTFNSDTQITVTKVAGYKCV